MANERPTVEVIRPRTRDGAIDHSVRVRIAVIPLAVASTPSQHAPEAVDPWATRFPHEQAQAISTAGELTLEQEMRAAKDPSIRVRSALASRPGGISLPEARDRLLTDKILDVRLALARSTVNEGLLCRLANDKSSGVREAVAHRARSEELLAKLSEDVHATVSYAARTRRAELFPESEPDDSDYVYDYSPDRRFFAQDFDH